MAIEDLRIVINLLPDNSRFGKLISILALELSGSYMIGDRTYTITEEEYTFLSRLVFFRIKRDDSDDVVYSINPHPVICDSNSVSITCFNHTPVFFRKGQEDYSAEIKMICDYLGYSHPMYYMEFSYALKSNMVILGVGRDSA